MQRLTEKEPYWLGEEFWTSAKEPDEAEIDAVYEKLKTYEDLEEQGLLLRLPVKIGDTVYYIASKPEDNYLILSVEEGIILKAEIFEKEMKIWVKELNGMCIYGLEDLKECVFLTKEEAEAKLKEMEV